LIRRTDLRTRPGPGRRVLPCYGGAFPRVAVAGIGALLLLVWLAGCSEDATDPPVLRLEPPSITLVPGDSTGSLTLSNAGQGTLSWQLESDAAWLSFSPRQGSTTESQAIDFTVVPESLRFGPPQATIEVASNGGSARARVRMWPSLNVDRDSLDMGDTTRTVQLVIMNTEADTLWWAADAADAWLSVSPTAGFLTHAPETLLVSADRAGLGAGDYAGGVRIDGGAFGRDTVHVSLVVPPTSGVLGRIFFAATRIPAAGIAVWIDDVADTTDALGRYILAGVPLGEHQLQARGDGFDDRDETIDLTGTGLRYDFEMHSSAHAHTVSGRAINRIDRGAGTVLITVLNPDGSPSGIHGLTVSDGTYTLREVPDGERRLHWVSYLYDTRNSDVTVDGDVTHDVRLVAKPLDPPYLPIGPALKQIDCAAVRVRWTPRVEETVGGYRVERAVYVGSEYEEVSGHVDASGSSFDDRTADGPGFRYRVRTETIDGLIGEASPHSATRLADWFLLSDGATGPRERWGHAAVYDPRARRMVVYAGLGCVGPECGVLFKDTWSLDLVSLAWERLDENTGPSERQDHRGFYDPVRHRMVVFGGRDVHSVFNDTWAFDLSAQTWARLDDGSAGPPPRYAHALAYDAATDRMVVYGGEDGSSKTLNDVWAFHLDANRWERLRTGEYGELDPQPEARVFPGAVLDPGRRRLIVYGGYTYSVNSPRGDTWALDLATATWTQLPDGHRACFGQAGIYDTTHDRAIFYGGSMGAEHSGDMVALSFDEEPHWGEIDDGPPGAGPGVRFYQTMIADPERGDFILFGGLQGSSLTQDAWTYCGLR